MKNSGGPSVGERTMDSPLFIRATSLHRLSEPAISLTSLWLGVVSRPSLVTMPRAVSHSSSVSRTSRAKSCKSRTSARMISLVNNE